MNRVLELSDVAPVFAPEHVIGFQKPDADEFLHECIPFALQAGFVCFWEGFLEHGKRPARGEGEGRVPLFQIACHLRTQRFELVFGARFPRCSQARDAVNIGRIGATNVFDKSRFSGRVERFNGCLLYTSDAADE